MFEQCILSPYSSDEVELGSWRLKYQLLHAFGWCMIKPYNAWTSVGIRWQKRNLNLTGCGYAALLFCLWGFMTKLGIFCCYMLLCIFWFALATCSLSLIALAQSALPQCERLKRLAVESDGCWHHGSLWHPGFTNCWPHQQSMASAVRHFVEAS